MVKQVQVSGSSSITAAGNSSTQIAEVNEDITFSSSTANAQTTVWNFGDGNTASTATATHNYAQEGTYTVTLTVTNADGCSSTLTQTITVNNKTAVGISNITKSNIRMWSSGNKVLVDFSKQKDVQAEIVIYDILGRELSKEPYTKSGIYSKEVLNTEAAYVIVKVMNGDELLTRKLFIGNR
ncbi:MAG: PKD domain-containing protein [Bacteroidetes bacterium]|nr:PKD domain-containing protein [Bacteroidota bacterium]